MTKDHRGAAAVEFAIVLPVLLVLLLGIIDFGYAFYVQGALSNAAREGARDMAIHNSPAAARIRVQQAATPLVVPNTAAAIAISPAACAPNTNVTVTVTYTYTYLTGFFGKSVVMKGKGEMRCGG